MPTSLLGFQIVRQPGVESQFAKPGAAALVSGGRVFTVRDADIIQGSIQITLFKPDIDISDQDKQRGVERGLGSGRFETRHFGPIRLRVVQTPEQQQFIWYPPGTNSMELFVMRKKFLDAQAFVLASIAHQLQLEIADLAGVSVALNARLPR